MICLIMGAIIFCLIFVLPICAFMSGLKHPTCISKEEFEWQQDHYRDGEI